jgi:hypothetical protein
MGRLASLGPMGSAACGAPGPVHRIDLLASAHLKDLDMRAVGQTSLGSSVRPSPAKTLFGDVTFTNDAQFDIAIFTDDVQFGGATFASESSFRGVAFTGDTSFGGATLADSASFSAATFAGDTSFSRAVFAGPALVPQRDLRWPGPQARGRRAGAARRLGGRLPRPSPRGRGGRGRGRADVVPPQPAGR